MCIRDRYDPELAGVPQVCFKVPTGGGKTFLAANSLKPIFASMPHIHPKACLLYTSLRNDAARSEPETVPRRSVLIISHRDV